MKPGMNCCWPAAVALLGLSLQTTASPAFAQGAMESVPVTAKCRELNQNVMNQAANGQFEEAETMLSSALTKDASNVCTGLLLNNLAALCSVQGRVEEAERLAARSIFLLEQTYPVDDPALLRPLQILAASRFERGETARAREAFHRMQSIRIERPQDRALVHGMAAVLFEAEGQWTEAESEYRAALDALQKAGRGETADAGAHWNGLSSVYVKQQRWNDAQEALNCALAIFAKAADAVPMDRMKLLNTRAVLFARQGEWQRAEDDLRDALSIADRERSVDSVALCSLLSNYAHVLRRTHRKRDARMIEARLNAVQREHRPEAIVDVSDLLANSKGRNK